MSEFIKKAKTLQPELIEYRRKLHSMAEVGFHLPQTKRFIEEKLRSFGYEIEYCGKAILATVGQGEKSLLLRADMDALPLQEKTRLFYAAKTGNMHACGHDMHATMLLGAAKLLKQAENKLPCKIKLLFQPAEEILAGATDCIKSGVLEGVKGAITLHVMTDTTLPTGTVVVPNGGIGAPAADYFKISIKGKSCHGSAPQNGVDALTAACQTLISLQEIPARELPASSSAVLTAGKLIGGNAGNAIADLAEIEGTLRSFDEEERTFIKKRIKDISQNIAKAFRAQASVQFPSGCPVLVNDENLCARMYTCAKNHFNADMVLSVSKLSGDTTKRSGGSEDFAYFSQKVPSIMLAIAAGEREKGFCYPLHHPKVQFDESVLYIGSVLYCLFAFSD